MNFSFSFIKDWIASVICISPPFPGLNLINCLKIVFGKIYLPITALFDGAFLREGFSITSSMIKLFLSNFFF